MRFRPALLTLAFGVVLVASGAPAGSTPPPRAAATSARPARLGLDGLAFPTATTGWVVASVNRYGDPGLGPAEILGTANGGASWSVQWRGDVTPVQLTAIDSARAWLLADTPAGCAPARCRSAIVGTADGGASWSVLASFPERVNGIAFASARVGFAAVDIRRGVLVRTDDGGSRWRILPALLPGVVGVTAAGRRVWAVQARRGRHPAFVVAAGADDGHRWHVRGRVRLDLPPSDHVQARLLPGRGLWLDAFDQDSCAMHGCGVDDVWHSAGPGRPFRAVATADPRDRRLGMPCATNSPIALALSGRTAYLGSSLDFQDCTGPAATLFALGPRRTRIVHRWPRLQPTALAWPARAVGYAMGRRTLRRSADGGRTWTDVTPPPGAIGRPDGGQR